MNLFPEYFAVRDFLISVSPYFRVISFVLAALMIATLAVKRLAALRLRLLYVSLLFYAVSFVLLFYFHWRASQIIKVQIPFEPYLITVFPPLWIESEKLFFWCLLTLLFSVIYFYLQKNQLSHQNILVFIPALFMILVSVFDPFSNPLPVFTGEVSALSQGVMYGRYDLVMRVAGKFLYYYNSTYMWTHPPLLFISYAFFLLAFPFYLAALFQKGIDFITWEKTAYLLTRNGYFFLTTGMLIGYPWAVTAWQGEPWWWSAKINVSILMWLLYTAYLHGRLYLGRDRVSRWSMITAVIAFLSLIFTYLTTYLIPGVHSYA